MTTIRAAAHKEQGHPLLPSCCGLEENSLSMPTEIAADSLGSGKSWIRSYILQDLGSLPSSVVHLVPIDTVIVRDLLMLAVATCKEQGAPVPVLLGVQDVVALATKLHGAHGCSSSVFLKLRVQGSKRRN